MERVNYDLMSEKELRQYFLRNRQDETAFHAYVDRLNERPRQLIAKADDPDFDKKMQAAILRKLAEAKIREAD